MKVSEVGMEELWLGRCVRTGLGNTAVICGLQLEIPKSRLYEENTLKQRGPRYSEISFYVLETRRLMTMSFIETCNLELLDKTLSTKDLYDLIGN